MDPSVTTPPVQQTQDEEEANDGDDDPNDFLADDPYYDGAHDDRYAGEGPVDHDLGGQKADLPDKYQCTKRLFCSQDTPEAAPEQVGLSQDTVQEAIKDAMAPKEPKKTGRKR